jgi:hypothetical protein
LSCVNRSTAAAKRTRNTNVNLEILRLQGSDTGRLSVSTQHLAAVNEEGQQQACIDLLV